MAMVTAPLEFKKKLFGGGKTADTAESTAKSLQNFGLKGDKQKP